MASSFTWVVLLTIVATMAIGCDLISSDDQDQAQLYNAADAPLLYDLFAPGEKRPLVTTLNLDLTTRPSNLVSPGKASDLWLCKASSDYKGYQLVVYRISDADATVALLSKTISSEDFLREIRKNDDCRLTVSDLPLLNAGKMVAPE